MKKIVGRHGMTMLVNRVVSRTGYPRLEVAEITLAVFTEVAEIMAAGDSVAISNFGTFSAPVLPAGNVRNPQTGSKMSVPERRRAKFRTSPSLKTLIQKPGKITLKKKPSRWKKPEAE